MKKRNLILMVIGAAIAAAALLYILTGNNASFETGEKQLYTCGMHPEIISDEPGVCPICEMRLVPIKNNTIASGKNPKDSSGKILYWRAPMDPNEIYDEPGKSKMGMDLVPVYEDEEDASGIVTINPAVIQNMNVKIEIVQSKSLSAEVVTNGMLTTAETSEYIVTTRVNGWVENLYVDYTGKAVNKGDRLMEIYSPELVAAQQELLTALTYQASVNSSTLSNIKNSGDDLLKNAVRKLQLLEISDKEIERLKETKDVKTYITLYAKKSGTVIQKNIIEGQKITAGTPLLQIANLNNLWLTADIYEYELAKIKIGSPAKIIFNYFPGKIYKGKVSFIYPTLDSKSRTIKVRIDVPNSGELKPSMFANVTINGEAFNKGPVIPENAVLRNGNREVVIIALGDGKFKPQPVKLGSYANGYYQVLDGLSEGTKIVTSAQFLIDSESNLRSAINQFEGEK